MFWSFILPPNGLTSKTIIKPRWQVSIQVAEFLHSLLDAVVQLQPEIWKTLCWGGAKRDGAAVALTASTPGRLRSFNTATGEASPVRPRAPNQRWTADRAWEPAVGAGRRWACRPAPLPLRRPAPSVAAPRPLARSAARRPSRAGASRAPGCGLRGMEPRAASGQGSGEPSAREVRSAEVSAAGSGERGHLPPPGPAGRPGSRGARALPRGRSPGQRSLRGPREHAPSLAGNGGSEWKEGRWSWGPGSGGSGEETDFYYYYYLEDLWPVVGVCN